MTTLTRAEAIDLIRDEFEAGSVRRLSVHWIGHDQEGLTDDEVADLLIEYVDAVATGDDQRSNGPKDTDDTGLTAP